MLKGIFKWILGSLKSRSAKIGGGILGSSGLIAGLLGFYTWTVDGISERANASEIRMVKYVDVKNDATLAILKSTVDHFNNTQTATNLILNKLDKRLYELKGER